MLGLIIRSTPEPTSLSGCILFANTYHTGLSHANPDYAWVCVYERVYVSYVPRALH